MIGRTNCKRGGSGNVTTVTLNPATSGATVTASRTGKTKTAVTDSNGVATFKNLDMGYDWTFSWSTFSKTVKIDQLTESITLGAITYTVYGKYYDTTISWTFYKGNSTAEADKILGPVENNNTVWTVLGTVSLIPGETYTVKGIGRRAFADGYKSSGMNYTDFLFGFGIFSRTGETKTSTFVAEEGWDGIYLYSMDD